jgi:hypothetical protein
VERRRAPLRTATALPLTLTVAEVTAAPFGTRSRILKLRRLAQDFVEGKTTDCAMVVALVPAGGAGFGVGAGTGTPCPVAGGVGVGAGPPPPAGGVPPPPPPAGGSVTGA